MKIDPSLSSMCMHAIFEMGSDMCNERVSTNLNKSSRHREIKSNIFIKDPLDLIFGSVTTIRII